MTCYVFLQNKYVKIPVKQSKSALLDFYSFEAIGEAKVRLLNDVKQLKFGVKFPHIPLHREGDGRMAREVDDLFTILQLLDEHKLLDSLPHYVCGNPHNMPSLRLFEGDMNVLLVMLEKVQRKVEEYGSALTTITRDVSQLQQKFATLSQARSTLDDQYPPLPSVSAKPRPPRSQQQPPQPALQPSAGNSVDDVGVSADRGAPDWATLSSTPYAHANRYSVLASTTDDEGGVGSFELAQSRKSKRLRNKSPQQSQHQAQQPPPTTTEKSGEQPSRCRPSVLGRSTAATNITAARKLRRKAVFCIDNVNASCTADDIESFVSSLSINVISVFAVKPRRRRIDSVRKAFRLCIFHEDRERLLDATIWPDSVIISDWFFKSESEREHNKKMRLDDMEEAETGAVADAAAVSVAAVATPAVDAGSDPVASCSMALSDDTIIAAYNVDSMDCAASNDHGN